MATDFQNSRRRRPPSWILVNMHFGCNSCVLCQIFNIPTKFGEDRSNSNEMATDFRKSIGRPPPSWILINMHFWCNSCVLCQILNIPIKFGEVRSTCKGNGNQFSKFKMAAAAIMNFRKYAFLMQHLRSMSDSQHSNQIWWRLVQ